MNKGATGKMKVSPLPEDKGDEEAAQEEEDDNPPPTKKSKKSVKSKSKIEKQTKEGMIFVHVNIYKFAFDNYIMYKLKSYFTTHLLKKKIEKEDK